jgi:transposase
VLIERFAQHLKPALVAQRMERVGQSAVSTLTFAWTGSTAPARGHYFRIQGERFLIEYDNS